MTPADYLEKIFQIPFWIPPLRTSAAQNLLGKLTAAPADAVPFGAATDDAEPEPESPAEGAGGGLSGLGSGAQGGSGSGAGRGASIGAGSDGADQRRQLAAPRPGRKAAREQPPPAMRPDLLRVSDGERTAMQSLAALIGRSPRATKRFVNSYRLLKVGFVAQMPARFDRDSEAVGPLNGPMFLLAVVTGLPTLAAEYVRMLPDNPAAGVIDQLAALADWAKADAQHVQARKRIEDFAASDAADAWRPLRGEDLLPWAAMVGQFSFEDLMPDGRDHAAPRQPPAQRAST